MKRKLPTVLILLVMALIGAMYWIDMSYYTDLATGFLLRGEVWMRYALLAVPVLMCLLGLHTLSPRAISVLRVRHRRLTLLFVLASFGGIAFGITRIVFSLQPLEVYELVMGALFVWYGGWMFVAALQLFVQVSATPTVSALPGVIAALPFCALTVYRIMIRPSALFRIAPVISAFSTLFAMLWFAMLLRSLYIALPLHRVRAMYLLGVFTFLFCTCLELPQTVHAALFRSFDIIALLESLNIGLLGVVAGYTSLSIAEQGEEYLPTSRQESY